MLIFTVYESLKPSQVIFIYLLYLLKEFFNVSSAKFVLFKMQVDLHLIKDHLMAIRT